LLWAFHNFRFLGAIPFLPHRTVAISNKPSEQSKPSDATRHIGISAQELMTPLSRGKFRTGVWF
jgi:hypothetical protein